MWRLSWSDSKCGVMVFSRKLWISLFSFKSCQWWSQPDSYRSNVEDRRETRERELHIPSGLWISQYPQERVIRWCGCGASLPIVLLSGPHEVGNNPVWSWPALFSTGSHALARCGDPDVGALWIFQLNSLPVSYLDRERHSCSMITQPWHFDDSEIQQLQFQATKNPIPGWNQLQAGFVWLNLSCEIWCLLSWTYFLLNIGECTK